jgi:hypothetical protein
MKADDLILLAISFDIIGMKININKKSMCLQIGKRHAQRIAPIVINNQELIWKQEIRYLGVFLIHCICKYSYFQI